MQWKRIGLAAAAGLMLLMSGCDAAADTAAASDAASETPAASESTVTASAAAAATDDAASALATPAAGEMIVPVIGTIVELNPEEHFVTVAEGEDLSDPSMMVSALVTEDTLLFDATTAKTIQEADLETGQMASAALSPQMTRSIPPQAQAFALITNLPANGVASYVDALDVMTAEDGSTVILNQNADLYITIPVDLAIEKLDSSETVPASDIKTGSRLIVWYETVAESYPAQTTASRVVLAD
ncbi:MAG: hypothetical protein HDQ87_04205 [Clostridia bacterium]|nr:hypothetical protein [Clostridia bacterium]